MSDEVLSDVVLPLKATLKAGGGYEAPWLTVAAENAAELSDMLDSITEDLLQKVVDTGTLFRAAHNVSAGTAPDAPVNTAAPAEQGDNVAHLKTCQHGVRQYREGTSKRTGKKYAGWYCPAQNKSEQCDVVWKD